MKDKVYSKARRQVKRLEKNMSRSVRLQVKKDLNKQIKQLKRDSYRTGEAKTVTILLLTNLKNRFSKKQLS